MSAPSSQDTPSPEAPAITAHRARRRSRSKKQSWQPWPQGMGGRIVLLVVIGLILAQGLTGIWYWRDRQVNITTDRIEALSQRIIAIYTLLSATPPQDRGVLLQAVNDPLLQVDVLAQPLRDRRRSSPSGTAIESREKDTSDRTNGRALTHQPNQRRHRRHRRHRRSLQLLETTLSRSIPSRVFVSVRRSPHPSTPPRPPSPDAEAVALPSLRPSHRHLVITIAAPPSPSRPSSLTPPTPATPGGGPEEESEEVPENLAAPNATPNADPNTDPNTDPKATPEWWVFTIPVGFRPRQGGPPFLLWLMITGLIIGVGSVWGTRRITGPLLQFAAAADRLGLNVNAPPLPERGSEELRQAAHAFNQMQARLQRLIRDRTFMLAAISHDLRTVLTRLRLRTEFIDDPVQQQKAQADLAQMELMLTSTVAFAKEDSTPEARTPLDIASLLQSICDDCVDAGHRVHFDGGDRLLIQGQPIALQRAFSNLIENAAIYGHEAEVGFTAQPDGVTIAIADRGPGIPAHQREDVFAPFFRLEQSRNRETGGTGLGLAVARTVIQRHGGTITLSDRWPPLSSPPPTSPHPSPATPPGLIVTVHLPGRMG